MRHELNTFTLHLPSVRHLRTAFHALLSPAEKQRAQRLCIPTKQAQFITVRSILRLLLAQKREQQPQHFNIEYRHSGKPFIRSQPDLYFNVSHCRDYAVFALSSQEVGIDIEYCQATLDIKKMLYVFSPAEKKILHQFDYQKNVFFELWTRKEAWAKLHGDLAHTDWSTWHVPSHKESIKLQIHRDYIARCMLFEPCQHLHHLLHKSQIKHLLEKA